MTIPIDTPLIREGEEVRRVVRFTREQIIQFARLTGDSNPLHHDRQAVERARFGEVIASGQQTSSHMMAVVTSHFSRRDDGVPREVLALHFAFDFAAPVLAEQDVVVTWCVGPLGKSTRRGGIVAPVQGQATVAGRACVIARGTLLVRRAGDRPGVS